VSRAASPAARLPPLSDRDRLLTRIARQRHASSCRVGGTQVLPAAAPPVNTSS